MLLPPAWQVPGWVSRRHLRSWLCWDLPVCQWWEVLPCERVVSLRSRLCWWPLWGTPVSRRALRHQMRQALSLPSRQHSQVRIDCPWNQVSCYTMCFLCPFQVFIAVSTFGRWNQQREFHPLAHPGQKPLSKQKPFLLNGPSQKC